MKMARLFLALALLLLPAGAGANLIGTATQGVTANLGQKVGAVTPLSLGSEFLINAARSDLFSPASGTVDSYSDPSANTHSFTATSNARPSLAGGVLAFDGVNDVLSAPTITFLGRTNLPNSSHADPAPENGFTCTGMTKLLEGGWAFSNHGKAHDTDPTYDPSIVITSQDFTTKTAEIGLVSRFPSIGSIQGIGQRTVDLSLGFASHDENLIRVIDRAGNSLKAIATGTSPNGLAYNPVNDSWFVIYDGGSTLQEYRHSDGVLIGTWTVGFITGLDHLWYDAGRNILWMSAGENGVTGGLYSFDPSTSVLQGPLDLTGSNTPEGVWIERNSLYIANDAVFHPYVPHTNNVTSYKLTSRSTGIYDMTFVASIGAAPSGYDGVIFSHGDVDTGAGLAVTVANGTSNTLKVIYNDGAASFNTSFILPATLLNTYSQIRVDVNLNIRSARVYQNGAYVGTGYLAGKQRLLTSSYYLGGDSDGRNLQLNLKDFVLYSYELSDTEYNVAGQNIAVHDGLSFTLNIVDAYKRLGDLLALWDFTDATKVTQSSNLISQISDSVGTRHLTAAGAERPTYSASPGSATFNGTTNVLYGTSPFMYADGSVTVAMAFKSDGGSNKYTIGEGSSSSNSPFYGLGVTNATNANDNVYGFIRNDANTSLIDTTNSLGSASWFNNTKKVGFLFDTGGQLSANDNGTAGTTPRSYTRSGALTLNRLALGAGMRAVITGPQAIEIFNIGVYGHVLTANEQNYLLPLLRTKNGL